MSIHRMLSVVEHVCLCVCVPGGGPEMHVCTDQMLQKPTC